MKKHAKTSVPIYKTPKDKWIVPDHLNHKKVRSKVKQQINQTEETMNQELTINITRSYARKLVPENYGIDGHKYSPLDYFASYGGSLPADATEEEVAELSARLQNLAHSDVENAIAAKLEELKSPRTDSLSQKDLDIVAPFIKLGIAEGAEKYETAVKAQKDAGKLTDKQLDFLRNFLKTLTHE